MYVNGTREASISSDTGSSSSDSGTLKLGHSSGDYFDGKIDDARIYDRALSASEVKDLYNAGGLAKRNATADPLFPNKLVSHWTMDGPDVSGSTVKDVKGSNDGTKQGDPIARSGRLGQALDFDGSDDYVSLNGLGSTTHDLSEMTVSFWFKTNNSSQETNSAPVSHRDDWDNYWAFLAKDNPDEFTATVQDNNVGALARASFTVGEWEHFTMVFRGNNSLKLYKNGTEKDSITDVPTTTPSLTATDAYIGRLQGTPNYIDGKIDDVRIYDAALSADEINRLYTATKPDTVNSSQNNKLTDGLVGMWSFDGSDLTSATATDVSANSNDGTLKSDPKPAIGNIGQALEFDGVDDYVEVSNEENFDIDRITVSFWARVEGQSSDNDYPRPVSKGQSATNNGAYGIRVTDPDQNGAGFRVKDSAGSTHDAVDSSGIENDKQWHHYVGVYDGSIQKFYIDGDQKGSNSWSGTINDVSDPVHIGDGNNERHFNGDIDNVRIYDRALSDNEIQRLYSLGR